MQPDIPPKAKQPNRNFFCYHTAECFFANLSVRDTFEKIEKDKNALLALLNQ